MSIFWLASYPKSGNTWLRAFLTNYLRSTNEGGSAVPASINDLFGGPSPVLRDFFDEFTGLDSSNLTPGELCAYRTLFHELLAQEMPSPAYLKVHDAYALAGGRSIFPRTATAGVVYVVRNPLDVAVSYAHYRQQPLDDTIDWMNDPTAAEGDGSRGIRLFLPQPLGTWSDHVSSWLNQRHLTVHVMRYEDMIAAPEAAFGAFVRFAGLDFDHARLARAIDHSAFERLRFQEARSGFREKSRTAPCFFRAGMAGSWRACLQPGQVRKLVAGHGPMMERLGYLAEAEECL